MKRIAIVILNWNGAHMLRRYLPSVIAHSTSEADIYVADNASSDDSLELLRRDFPSCKIIELDRNYGFAEGYNRALAQVEAEFFLLLNSDIEVTEKWLTPLLSYMDEHSEVAACQPKLRSMAEREMFEYAGASGGFLDRYGYPYCRGRLMDSVEKDDGQYDAPLRVLWATGAALLIRAQDYREAGGLDGRFFAHQEEIDLCWRLGLRGRGVACVPQSMVFHVGGGTLPKANPMKTFLNFRNSLTMLYKNLPANELAHVMRVRWWLDYMAAFKMLLLERNMGECKAVFRARKAFAKWKHDFDGDRKRMEESRSTDRAEGHTHVSLLWQYYVKGKRKYSEL